ncbi:MAG: glycosyltransferase family 9 protein [Nitrospirota bacterium]
MLKKNCRHYRDDRPCCYHKQEGIVCSACSCYSPIKYRILIIKLDAIGDVLRTTCILHGLKKKYPGAGIFWLTKKASIPLLQNNPLIETLWSLEDDAHIVLNTDDFDLVINPDASPTSARLATIARSNIKLGFGYNSRGYTYPYNEEAMQWFQLGVNDQLKKANTETYQTIIMRMCRLNSSKRDIVYSLTLQEAEFVHQFRRRYRLQHNGLIVGMNTGASGRWPQKKWTVEGYISLIHSLIDHSDGIRVLLFGGPGERERNSFIMRTIGSEAVIDTGHNNTLRNFAALLSIPDVLVTGDTLAMHLALALNRKVIALFGPTSHNEIDLYGLGEKIYPDMDCLVCYKQTCDKSPTCMQLIKPETVYLSITKLLGI